MSQTSTLTSKKRDTVALSGKRTRLPPVPLPGAYGATLVKPKRAAPSAGKRDAPSAGRREAPSAGRRDAPSAGKREAPSAGRRDAPSAGRRDARADPKKKIEEIPAKKSFVGLVNKAAPARGLVSTVHRAAAINRAGTSCCHGVTKLLSQ